MMCPLCLHAKQSHVEYFIAGPNVWAVNCLDCKKDCQHCWDED